MVKPLINGITQAIVLTKPKKSEGWSQEVNYLSENLKRRKKQGTNGSLNSLFV